MTTSYNDIIDHPHHVSPHHPQMSMRDRAVQFSPFAALVGYEEAISETARLTEQYNVQNEQKQMGQSIGNAAEQKDDFF